MSVHCCSMMHAQLTSTQCATHSNRYDCPDVLIDYLPQFDEYAIIVHDGGPSVVTIQFCPWCGTRLPPSRRAQWFEEIEKLGFSNPEDERIPVSDRTGEWYTN